MSEYPEYERKVHYAFDQSARKGPRKVANTLCAMNSKVPDSHITTDTNLVTCQICRKDKRFGVLMAARIWRQAPAPPLGGLVPGKRRYRVNWRGKVILQVADVVPVNYDPATDTHTPRYYAYRWRDATVADIQEEFEACGR